MLSNFIFFSPKKKKSVLFTSQAVTSQFLTILRFLNKISSDISFCLHYQLFVYNIFFYLHGGSFNRLSSFIFDKSFNPTMSLPQKLQEGVSIVIPELRQFCGRGEFAATEFQSDLHTSMPNVIVVLHTTSQRVPCCTICCAITECWSSDLVNKKSF